MTAEFRENSHPLTGERKPNMKKEIDKRLKYTVHKENIQMAVN